MLVSDEELVRTRDTAELVRRYYDDVYRFARHLLRDEADAGDAAQETFVRAFSHLDSYRYDGSLKVWLFSITSNHIRDLFRRRKLLPLDPAVEESLPDETPEENALINEENRQEVMAVLQHLPFDLQTVVVLHFQHELTFREISKTLGVSVNAVRIRLYRALVALRKELA